MTVNLAEKLKKLYNKLDFATIGLDNRIIAAHGINILIANFPILCFFIPGSPLISGVIDFMTIPIGIVYIVTKAIIKYLKPKSKIPNPNISVYLLAGILFAIYICIFFYHFSYKTPVKYVLVILGFTSFATLIVKTPFLPDCKLKHFQKKLEKNIIKISFIAFFIMSIIMILIFMSL